MFRPLLISTCIICSAVSADTPVVYEDFKLVADDGESGDEFGWSVSMNNGTALVGVYEDDDNGGNSGSAYIYRFDGSSWVETKLIASDGANGDEFGISVSISNNRAIIGARSASGGSDSSGAAYIFQFDGKNWIEEAKLFGNGSSLDFYGQSVCISENRVVVGARLNGTAVAYVYKLKNASWILEQRLDLENVPSGYFTQAVYIENDSYST